MPREHKKQGDCEHLPFASVAHAESSSYPATLRTTGIVPLFLLGALTERVSVRMERLFGGDPSGLITRYSSTVRLGKSCRPYTKKPGNSTGGGCPRKRRAKHCLNQKDFKSATTQAAPVTRKVRTHSDQLKCAFG